MVFAFDDFLGQQLLDAMFEQNVFGIGVRLADPEGPRWLDVNNRMCEALGYDREELLGLTVFDFTFPEDYAASREASGKLVREEIGSYKRERRCRHKDGHEIWANAWVSPLRETNGEI